MEVTFRYVPDDWAAVSTEAHRLWLYCLRPMTLEERVGSAFFLILSVLALPGLLGFLAAGFWFGYAWYWLVGAAVLLIVPCVFIRAVVWPSDNGTRRGLYHDLLFYWKLDAEMVAKARRHHQRQCRRMDAAGKLNLGHRYVARLEADGLVWITTYPPQAGSSTTQEDRIPWSVVTAIEPVERLLVIRVAEGGILSIPRSAFADDQEERDFVRAAEERRAAIRERVMAPAAATGSRRHSAVDSPYVTSHRSTPR